MKIMLIDDDQGTQVQLSTILKAAGYEFCGVTSAKGVVDTVKKEMPNLILLDVILPQEDGYSICRKLRAEDVSVPIIFISVKGEITDKMVGFSAGGDDYFAKPFDAQELLLHVQALLRRERQAERAWGHKGELSPFKVGRFEFDQSKFVVRKDGQPIALTPKEFNILFTLACNEGEVVSQKQLIKISWGEEYLGEITSLAVYIRRIRRKIEEDPSDPQHLVTCWGVGYSFDSGSSS